MRGKFGEAGPFVALGKYRTHADVIPPSTAKFDPTQKLAASERRKTTASAISPGFPKRPFGYFGSRLFMASSLVSLPSSDLPIAVSAIVPGDTQLTLTPSFE